jgi:predicted esterase
VVDAEDSGVILLAPDSRGRTWDVLLDGYGPDVAFIDRALDQTFRRCAVDPTNVVVEGFSDGASYALGLGLANGNLFRRVIAFSPGYVPSADTEGRPSVFVSHGIADDVLPIDHCSRRIVPALRKAGYDVDYREFEGGHEVPAEIAADALSSVRAGIR